jgi:hypothetical protein
VYLGDGLDSVQVVDTLQPKSEEQLRCQHNNAMCMVNIPGLDQSRS